MGWQAALTVPSIGTGQPVAPPLAAQPVMSGVRALAFPHIGEVMGRSAEAWQQQKELEDRIASERAEAEYFAIPDALHKNLETTQAVHKGQLELIQENGALREQVTALQRQIDFSNRPSVRWRERGYGFILGALASVLASVVWWQMTKHWTIFQ